MTRLTYQELEQVKKKHHVSRLWSWSRMSCFTTSPYEYYLKYILHKKEDRRDSIYATVGGICHQIIEDLYSGKIKYEDMPEAFDDAWLTCYKVSNLKFDRNDEEKNEKLAQKYKDNLGHFFSNHRMLSGSVALEKFLLTKVGSQLFNGYADAVTKDSDGNFVIIDWKTSSIYKGKTLENNSGQLTIYAMALMQAGVPMEKVKAAFNFLKYVTITYQQKNGAVKTRDVERCKIGESLQTNARMWLKDAGYSDEEADEYLKMLLDANDINVLPEEVCDKYEIYDCYVYIPLSQELIDKWRTYITSTLADIMAREKDYEETKNEKIWWDDEESVKRESYYFSNLCGYSANLHKPYQRYLESLENSANGLDMFANVGSQAPESTRNNDTGTKADDIDLSWLDDIL